MIIIENMDDVPDSCLTCPFPLYEEYFTVYGEYVTREKVCPLLDNLCVEDYCDNETKPSNCPLKEVK